MAGRYLEAARVELGAHALGLVQVGTDRLDVAVAGLFDGVQHAVKSPSERSVYSWMERMSVLPIGVLVVSGIRGAEQSWSLRQPSQ